MQKKVARNENAKINKTRRAGRLYTCHLQCNMFAVDFYMHSVCVFKQTGIYGSHYNVFGDPMVVF